jgi:hypothetical protein
MVGIFFFCYWFKYAVNLPAAFVLPFFGTYPRGPDEDPFAACVAEALAAEQAEVRPSIVSHTAKLTSVILGNALACSDGSLIRRMSVGD